MSRAVACVLCSFLLLLFSCSQTKKTENEETAYWRSSLDSAYVLLYKLKDTTKALAYYDSVLNESSQVSVYPKAVRYQLLADYFYFFTADNHETARMIDSSLALYSRTELQDHYPRTHVKLLLFGGQIAYRLSQYTKANDYYFRAKKLADAHLTPCERKSFNYSIAMVLYKQRNFPESEKYFTEAYRLQNTCSPQTAVIALQQQEIQSNIGLCLIHQKKFDSALLHFDKALQIAEYYKDSLGIATMDKIRGVIYGNKAQIHLANNRLEEAETFALKSIHLNDREGYEVENAREVKTTLAEVYWREGAYPSMLEVLHGIQDATPYDHSKTGLEWTRLMASYYEHVHQQDSAILYYRNYLSLRDSLEDDQRQLTAADVARQMDEKVQATQIAVLKKDRQSALAYFWIAVAFFFLAMIIIYLVYHNYRRSRKTLSLSNALHEEIIRQKKAREEEVRQHHKLITEAVIQAQEAERSTIGLELHDNINQLLTTVKLHNEMVLNGVGDPAVVMPRALRYLQECIDGIRILSRCLSAPTLGKISLEESVKDLIDSINSTSKIKITRSIYGLDDCGLKQELHTGVYRILQEQLNNVLKHANASEVSVQLERNHSQIRLSITDNGKGFIVGKTKNGMGILNMQTRAENLNGTFDLQTEPGKGCTIEVVLPYDHKR